MSEIRYAVAWRRDDAELAAGAKAFWKTLGMPLDQMDERVPQLCNVALVDGRVVGVSEGRTFESFRARQFLPLFTQRPAGPPARRPA